MYMCGSHSCLTGLIGPLLVCFEASGLNFGVTEKSNLSFLGCKFYNIQNQKWSKRVLPMTATCRSALY